ncbi:hypothetical protein, partial [Trueperella sp.]|uniref:hypothetical protein n=1 Tax=Trueperella sp. TaxID=2699835 RepID=UPI00263443D3
MPTTIASAPPKPSAATSAPVFSSRLVRPAVPSAVDAGPSNLEAEDGAFAVPFPELSPEPSPWPFPVP